jgi:hypothetical protein
VVEWNMERAKTTLRGVARDVVEQWLTEYAVMLADVAVDAPAVLTLRRWQRFEVRHVPAAHEATILLYMGYVLRKADVGHWLALERALFSMLYPLAQATAAVVAPLLDWLEIFAEREQTAPTSPEAPIGASLVAPITWMRALDQRDIPDGALPVPAGLESLLEWVRSVQPVPQSTRESRITLSLRAMATPSWEDVGYIAPAPRVLPQTFQGPRPRADELAQTLDIEDMCSAKYAPPCMRNAIGAVREGVPWKNSDRWPVAEWFAGVGFLGADGFATVKAYVSRGGEDFEKRLHTATNRGGHVLSCETMRKREPPGTVSHCPFASTEQCAHKAGLPVGSFHKPSEFVVAMVMKRGSGGGGVDKALIPL